MSLLNIYRYDTLRQRCTKDFDSVNCKYRYQGKCCACSPDSSSKFKHKCLPNGKGMPDCYLVLGKDRYLVECKCDVEEGSNTSKEPDKLIREIDEKFSRITGFTGTRIVVLPKHLNKPPVIYHIRKRGWQIEFCGNEICCVCQWCS